MDFNQVYEQLHYAGGEAGQRTEALAELRRALRAVQQALRLAG
ncbi:MAG: hypothetical protein R3E95_17790 [Thiolinea sp.]